MNEVKRVYFDELKEKSALARSARLQKRTINKEIYKMNTPCYTVNVNEFIEHNKFKALPDSLKKEYLEAVMANWRVGPSAIAKMWGITSGTIAPIMKRLDVKRAVGKTTSAATRRFFAEFVKQTPKRSAMSFCGGSLSFSGLFNEADILTRLKAIAPADRPIKVSIVVEVAD